MSMLVMAVDIGFASTGLSVFRITDQGPELVDFTCVKSEKIKKTKGMSQVEVDVHRIRTSVAGIRSFMAKHDPCGMVVEMPTGGSKSSRATRAMGIATATIVAISELLQVPGEWYNPFDIKQAAVQKNAAEKDEIMIAMADIFPEILILPKNQMEHVADSCACMLAAMDGEMVGKVRQISKERL
jgi:Holliday junction resolvasome RuvABC endonuclease subunit